MLMYICDLLSFAVRREICGAIKDGKSWGRITSLFQINIFSSLFHGLTVLKAIDSMRMTNKCNKSKLTYFCFN